MSAKKNVGLPVNTGWFVSNQHDYAPRNAAADVHAELVAYYLAHDQELRHMFADCPARWIITVQLGRGTVHLNLYTEEELNSRQRCTERDLSRMAVMAVNRDMDAIPAAASMLGTVATSFPRAYCARSLNAEERARLDRYQLMLEEDGVEGFRAKANRGLQMCLDVLSQPPAEVLHH